MLWSVSDKNLSACLMTVLLFKAILKSGAVRRLPKYSFNVNLDSMKMFPLSDVSISNASEI